MAMSSKCCLNILPPSPDLNSIPVVRSLVSRVKIGEEPSKRKNAKLVTSLACALIGLEIAINPILMPNNEITHEISMLNNIEKRFATKVKTVGTKGGKWSDKRKCPPWNLNSFETIVPENLPRPSAHRRWESIAYDSHGHSLAPPVKTITIIKSKPGCFSM